MLRIPYSYWDTDIPHYLHSSSYSSGLLIQIATDNATDLIQELTVLYNKSRQQAITNELLDIVSGSLD